MSSVYAIFDEAPTGIAALDVAAQTQASLPITQQIYPPPLSGQAGGAAGSGTDIFASVTGGLASLGASYSTLVNAVNQNKMSTLQNKTQLELAQITAETQLAKARAALNSPASMNSILLILAIVGAGIAFMQYAGK